jgi:hypothetical protein
MDSISSYYSSFSDSTSSMGSLFWPTLIFIIMVIILVVVYFKNTEKNPGPVDYMPKMVSLSKATYPLTSNQAYKLLFSGSGSTLAGLFHVTIGDRTNQLSGPKTNAFTTLFGVYGSMEFQIAPANISTMDSTARLLIATQSSKTEIVPLPALPAQKWVFIAILRDGRRYDVLYNNKIVASHRLDSLPNTAIQNQLQVGSNPASLTAPSRFLGHAIHLFALDRRMSSLEVAKLRSNYVDTTGAPPDPLPFPVPIQFPSLRTVCIPGVPCNPVDKPPPNALEAWSSPYA